MKRFFSGWALVFRDGSRIFLLVLYSLFLSTCQSHETSEEVLEWPSVDMKKIIHPAKATYWETKKIVTIQNFIPEKDLRECQAQLSETAKKIQDENSLLEIFKEYVLKTHVKMEFYHWCFYYSELALEDELAEGQILLSEKVDHFQKQMNMLWVVARCMDWREDAQHYFDFLRTRYMELSKEYFGRSLEIIDVPLDEREKLKEKMQNLKGPS